MRTRTCGGVFGVRLDRGRAAQAQSHLWAGRRTVKDALRRRRDVLGDSPAFKALFKPSTVVGTMGCQNSHPCTWCGFLELEPREDFCLNYT